MVRKLILFTLILAGSHASAFEFSEEVTDHIGGMKIDAYINEKEIRNAPPWAPFESQPPLSVEDALTAVQMYVRKDKGSAIVGLVGIGLKPLEHHESAWHYVARLRVAKGDRVATRFYVVMMDGKVFPAIKEPQSIK